MVPSISALKGSRFIHVETHYIINLYRISYYRGGQAKDSCIRPRTHRLTTFQVSQRTKDRPFSEQTSALVVGNPKLPSTVSEQWGWGDIPYSEQEAAIVAEMLQAKPLTQAQANKDQVVRKMSQVCAHVALEF